MGFCILLETRLDFILPYPSSVHAASTSPPSRGFLGGELAPCVLIFCDNLRNTGALQPSVAWNVPHMQGNHRAPLGRRSGCHSIQHRSWASYHEDMDLCFQRSASGAEDWGGVVWQGEGVSAVQCTSSRSELLAKCASLSSAAWLAAPVTFHAGFHCTRSRCQSCLHFWCLH